MMRRLDLTARGIACAIAAVLAACGGAQKPAEEDPIALLAAGRYGDARRAVEDRGGRDPEDLAIVALCRIAEGPSRGAAERAVEALREAPGEAGPAVAAVRMMEIAFSLPRGSADEIHPLACEAALGAAGRGPLAPSDEGPAPGSEVSRDLAISVLERLDIWLSSREEAVESTRLLQIWNGCYSLLGGSVEIADDVSAWRLYSSVAGLALFMEGADEKADLTSVLLETTVAVIEGNPDITVAVRCDLSSPFDRLRTALFHDRARLGRMERAVASADGCKRGKYAPTSRE